MRSKAIKTIVMAVVLAAVLVVTGLPEAQSKQIAAGNLKQLAALNAATSKLAANGSGSGLTTAICILNAANLSITDLNACNDDVVCKSGVLLDALLDILVCINPDDPNLALFQCISNAVVDLADIKTTCNGDQACAWQKIIPVVVSLSTCFGQGTGTSGN